jgi:hypothetical protein
MSASVRTMNCRLSARSVAHMQVDRERYAPGCRANFRPASKQMRFDNLSSHPDAGLTARTHGGDVMSAMPI